MADLTRFFPAGVPPILANLAQLLWIFQIALVIHVYRTGRPYWWTWILFMAPLIGGLAYVVVELLPDFRSPDGLLHSLKPRKWRIADLRERLDESETVTNRLALAEELFAAEETVEAHAVAHECLKGVFRDDPRTLVDVARYKIALGQYVDAYAILSKVDTTGNRILGLELQVLRGDCLTAMERFEDAEVAYQSVAERFIGEAPRMGLSAIRERTGRHEEAIALWKEVLKKFRKASPAWRRTERKWYKLAKQKLEKK